MTKIESFEALQKALETTPTALRDLVKQITEWIGTVKAEMPVQLKTGGKLVAVVLDYRRKLAELGELGADNGKTKEQFAEDWLGLKPNRTFFQLATAFNLVAEKVYDRVEVGALRNLAVLRARLGDMVSLNDAVKTAVAVLSVETHVEKGKEMPGPDYTQFQAVLERVVQTDENGGWKFLSEAEFVTWKAAREQANALAGASKASLDGLLAVAVAGSIADTVSKETAQKAFAHLERLHAELAKKLGLPEPTTEKKTRSKLQRRKLETLTTNAPVA